MKIAFLYGPMSVGSRYFDFDNLYASPRGLTGSELSFFEISNEMARRGHDVELYVHMAEKNVRRPWVNGQLSSLDQFPESIIGWDAVCAWNEPDLLRSAKPPALRLCNQQLNDFDYCHPGFDEHVDVYTSPSDHHRAFISAMTPSPEKWVTLGNGCDPKIYRSPSMPDRVPGRVIWASSADRGLHHLLQMWPSIKRAVPHASLRCFYNFAYESLEHIESGWTPDLLEVAQRVRYIRYALERLKPFDVEHCGSVSRTRIAEEFARAQVFAYPCDTVRYTEGFSVATLEACASGAVPIVSSVDALGSIYADGATVMKWPIDLDEFAEHVVCALKSATWRDVCTERALALAERFTWEKQAEELERIVQERRASAEAAE